MTPRASVATATQIAPGKDHICAVLPDKTATCWGNNTYGQLGNGMTSMYSNPVVVGVANVVQLGVDRHHGCARDTTGDVWWFGEGYTPVPTKVAIGRPAVDIAAGAGHDCAILDDGSLVCWGNQHFGQLGDGTAASSRTLTPVHVPICP